ncbi:MAG TPA: hypothetical protein PLM07_03435 [Candidatus Rifleibacterium sp.]|nr:hypothetical protein [Candidatus Rifleibacterium sp.]HPT44936.1 hypothetical protein [Candidatus Rifleibacterium sp.]
MNLKNLVSGLWKGKDDPEHRLKKLLEQIETAAEDLKFKIATAIANISGLERKLAEAEASEKPEKIARHEMITASIASEKNLCDSLQQLFKELQSKKSDIELAIDQNHARQRQAAANDMLALIYRDFGSDLKLNTYLDKFASETFKVAYNAESKLKIELLKNRPDQ